MSVPKEIEEYFEHKDFDEAFAAIDGVLERLKRDHQPTDNLDCTCGDGPLAFADGDRNPMTNDHLQGVYILHILYAFETRRRDVIRIDPGEDDPLAPEPSDARESMYDYQARLYAKYVSARGGSSVASPGGPMVTPVAWFIPGTSTSSSSSAISAATTTPPGKPGLPKKTNTGPTSVAYRKRGK